MGEIRRFFGVAAGSTGSGYRVVASTSDYDGDGIRIPVESWDLSAAREFTPLLWNHDRSEPAIGTVTHVEPFGDRLEASFEFADPELLTERGAQIRKLWEAKVLRAVSVGATIDGPVKRERSDGGREVLVPERMTLRELSVVNVGADPAALGRSLELHQLSVALETQTKTPATRTERPRLRDAESYLAALRRDRR